MVDYWAFDVYQWYFDRNSKHICSQMLREISSAAKRYHEFLEEKKVLRGCKIYGVRDRVTGGPQVYPIQAGKAKTCFWWEGGDYSLPKFSVSRNAAALLDFLSHQVIISFPIFAPSIIRTHTSRPCSVLPFVTPKISVSLENITSPY